MITTVDKKIEKISGIISYHQDGIVTVTEEGGEEHDFPVETVVAYITHESFRTIDINPEVSAAAPLAVALGKMPETVHLKCLPAARAWGAAISESEALDFLLNAAPPDNGGDSLCSIVRERHLAAWRKAAASTARTPRRSGGPAWRSARPERDLRRRVGRALPRRRGGSLGSSRAGRR